MRRLKARRVEWLVWGHTHRMECKATAGARAPARGLGLLWETALLPSTLHAPCHGLQKGGLPFPQMTSEKLPRTLRPPIPASLCSWLPGGSGLWSWRGWREPHSRCWAPAQAHSQPALLDPGSDRWPRRCLRKGPEEESWKKSNKVWGERILHVTAYSFSFKITFSYSFWKPFQ